jgi:polyisoprenoid-binding protein YceI
MTRSAGLVRPAWTTTSGPPRKHHWWRWIAAAAVLLLGLTVVAVALFIEQPAPAPLALLSGPVSAPSGPVNGAWVAAAGSVAGFRVRESALGLGKDVVGRTSAVTGDLVISADRVTSAAFRIRLAAIKVNGKRSGQLAASLGARQHPVATFTLARPVSLGQPFVSGSAVTVRAAGQLTLRGVTRPVIVTLSGRRTGTALQAAGTIPVAFPAWGINGPGGFGFLGSLANHGVAEFLLTLHRQ